MKKIVLTLLLVSCLPMAHADEYIKSNGALSLSTGNGTAEFSINASHGNASGVCNMEGIAESVECRHRAAKSLGFQRLIECMCGSD